MLITPPNSSPEVLLTSDGRDWARIEAALIRFPRGVSHAPSAEMHRLGLHMGPPVRASCACDGRRMQRVQKSGDIDIVPAGMDGSWEDDADSHVLQLSLAPVLLREIADELGRKDHEAELLPRFQMRDARIEAIAWAIKADLEADTPSDPLYVDLLAHALAVRLIETMDRRPARSDKDRTQKFSDRQLRLVTEFIESNLDRKLHLADLTDAVGISGTRLKTLFRNSTGVPVHQYVIRRRVDYATALLSTTEMPPSEVAVAAGFSHQSHMASTMRRLTGQTPSDITRLAAKFRPKLQKTV
jgi:AraC family transcriptional regulator